jgi:hypothetical protein
MSIVVLQKHEVGRYQCKPNDHLHVEAELTVAGGAQKMGWTISNISFIVKTWIWQM